MTLRQAVICALCVLYHISQCFCCENAMTTASKYLQTGTFRPIGKCSEWFGMIKSSSSGLTFVNISTKELHADDGVIVTAIFNSESKGIVHFTGKGSHTFAGIIWGTILITIYSKETQIKSAVTISFQSTTKLNDNEEKSDSSVTVLTKYGGEVRMKKDTEKIVHIWMVGTDGNYDATGVNFPMSQPEDFNHLIRLFTISENKIAPVHTNDINSGWFATDKTILIFVRTVHLQSRLYFSYLSVSGGYLTDFFREDEEVAVRGTETHFGIWRTDSLTKQPDAGSANNKLYQIQIGWIKPFSTEILQFSQDKGVYRIEARSNQVVLVPSPFLVISFYQAGTPPITFTSTGIVHEAGRYNNRVCGGYIDSLAGTINVKHKFGSTEPRFCTFIFPDVKGTTLELNFNDVDLSPRQSMTITVDSPIQQNFNLPYMFIRNTKMTRVVKIRGTVTLVHRSPDTLNHLKLKIKYSRAFCGGYPGNIITHSKNALHHIRPHACLWYIPKDYANYVTITVTVKSRGYGTLRYGNDIFATSTDRSTSTYSTVTLRTPVSFAYHAMYYTQSTDGFEVQIKKAHGNETDTTLGGTTCFQTINMGIQTIRLDKYSYGREKICLFHVEPYENAQINVGVTYTGRQTAAYLLKLTGTDVQLLKEYSTKGYEDVVVNGRFALLLSDMKYAQIVLASVQKEDRLDSKNNP